MVLGIGLIVLFNPSTQYSKLCVNDDMWNSIKSSRKESENLILEDIEFNDYNLIIDKSNNTFYYSLVNDSPNKFNPSVRYKSNNANTKIVILSDEINNEKVKSNHTFKIMIYNEKEYRIYDLKCTDLPIVDIQYEGNDIEKRNPMKIYVFNNLSNTPNRITTSNGKFKAMGNNFAFSLNMITPGNNKRDNRISILNMRPSSEYILTPTNENSENKNGPKGQRVELFINGSYVGTYSLGYMQERVSMIHEKGMM